MKKAMWLPTRSAETVICVDERMNYTDVKNILEDTDEEAKKRYADLVPMFFLMKELSQNPEGNRHHRGSIDFDFPESKIILNAAGRAIWTFKSLRAQMWQPGSLRISCSWQTRQWQKIVLAETICRLYTVPTRIRIRRRWKAV